jgi:hypothetical protein
LVISVLAAPPSAPTLNEVSLPSLSFRAVRSSMTVLAWLPSALRVTVTGSLENLAASAFAWSRSLLNWSRATLSVASMSPAENVMTAHRPSPK